MIEHAARMGQMKNAYITGILVGKPEWRRPFETLRCRWEDDIRMGIVGRCGLESSDSCQGSVACSCQYVNEPSCSMKGGHFVTEWPLTSLGYSAT
jgi:hypothetical protein